MIFQVDLYGYVPFRVICYAHAMFVWTQNGVLCNIMYTLCILKCLSKNVIWIYYDER